MQGMLDVTGNSRGSAGPRWASSLPNAQSIMRAGSLGGILLACVVGIAFGLASLISPLLAIALGLAILVFVSSLSRPILLCYLVISAIVLMSGIERGRLFPALTGNEVSLLGAVGIALLIVLAEKRPKVAIPGYFWLALCLLVGGVVFIPTAVFLLQGVQLNPSSAFKMFSQVQYFLLFWLFAVLPQTADDRRRIIWWMLAFGALVAVVGLAQGAGIGSVKRLLQVLYASSHESVAATAGRVTSLLGSWNSLGIFMMAVCLISWALLLETEGNGQRLLLVGVLAACGLCLVASGSYAGILGLAIGLCILQLLSRHRARSLPLVLTVVIIAIPFAVALHPFLQALVQKRLADQFQSGSWMPQTLAYRFYVWRTIFIPAIQAHFPWAVYPTVPTYYAWQFEESQYILLLFRTGLIGFLSFLGWLVVTIGWLYQGYRRLDGFDKAIASAALAIVLVLAIAGFTNEVFSFAGTIDYLWIMLALVAGSKVAK